MALDIYASLTKMEAKCIMVHKYSSILKYEHNRKNDCVIRGSHVAQPTQTRVYCYHVGPLIIVMRAADARGSPYPVDKSPISAAERSKLPAFQLGGVRVGIGSPQI